MGDPSAISGDASVGATHSACGAVPVSSAKGGDSINVSSAPGSGGGSAELTAAPVPEIAVRSARWASAICVKAVGLAANHTRLQRAQRTDLPVAPRDDGST